MLHTKPDNFFRYAWFALGYNVLVILGGVFLRASHSGDGCGQHWLTCHGEAVPSAPQLKTLIEFSHRLTTAIAGLIVLVLVIWAFRKFERESLTRYFAGLSFFFILVEGAIGGGLVLTGNTAANWTPTRPYWAAGHLVNTFALIAFLTLTAWSATLKRFKLRRLVPFEITAILVCIASMLLVGVSGSMASLAHMLFPSETIAEGMAKDFDPNSHWLLRLRILHPILSIFAVVFTAFIVNWMKRRVPASAKTAFWVRNLSILLLVQLGFGAVTLLTLAPIVMQLVHLLLADLVWIAFVLVSANFISEPNSTTD